MLPVRSGQRPACLRSVVSNSAIPWTVASQAPLTMEFSRQEYWSGLPFPSPGELPNPGIKPTPPAWQADFFFTTGPLGKPEQRSGKLLIFYGVQNTTPPRPHQQRHIQSKMSIIMRLRNMGLKCSTYGDPDL